MNKKQMLEHIWDYMIENTPLDALPEKPGDNLVIQWNMHITYGDSANTLRKHIKKRPLLAKSWMDEDKYDDTKKI